VTPAGKERMLLYPTRRDPRWVVLAFLLSFAAYAISSPGYHRTVEQFALGVATCVLLDGALIYSQRGALMFPMSGLVSSMGLLLLTDSPLVWVYPVIGAVCILSKHFIRVRGRHIFNPLNFGVVVALLFLSSDVTVVASRWGGSTLVFVAVLCLGILAAYRANRLDIAIAYVAAFYLGVLVRVVVLGAPFTASVTPMTGAAFQLFAFFMLTDPMTTPENRTGRLLFGVTVAVLDNVMRVLEIRNAPFYALFLVSGLLPFFRDRFPSADGRTEWRIAARPLHRRRTTAA
jgi:enediyne biosynthesis protein E5